MQSTQQKSLKIIFGLEPTPSANIRIHYTSYDDRVCILSRFFINHKWRTGGNSDEKIENHNINKTYKRWINDFDDLNAYTWTNIEFGYLVNDIPQKSF